MKKLFLITVALFCFAVTAFAQTYTIKGRLCSGKSVLDYASVVLQKADSSFAGGMTTDANGRFRMDNVALGSYRLTLSSIGYNTKYIDLKDFSHDVDLGNIELDSTSVMLKEVTVTSAKVIRTPDMQVAIPTRFQLKASTNGLELLKAMQLSRLNVDIVNNGISTSAQGEVQLRINGAKSDIHQVKALRPENIQRIDYHDDPGMQYGQGVACVIDYITKRPVSGGDISFDLRNSPFDVWGQDQIDGSYNKGKSQFGGYLWEFYNGLHGWRENIETFNYADGTSFVRTEDGEKAPYGNNNLFTNLYYNYKEGEKWFLNVTFNLFHYNENATFNSLLYPINDHSNSVDMYDKKTNITNRPWLDMYFQRNYGKNRTLIFNVVTTYIHNNVERNYTEDKNNVRLTDITSLAKGNKYSVIGEAIYTIGLTKDGKMSFGMSGSQAYTNNDYTGTVNATTTMHDGYVRGFTEWRQRIGKFNYSLGAYLSYIWMLQGMDKLYNTEWYPKASMSYTINKNSYIRLSGERSYTTPALSDLSNVTQIIDSLQIRRGNPNLKVSHTWQGNLFYEWRKNWFSVNASLFYMYQQNPVMEETLLEGNKFIRTIDNQKSWQKVNPELQLQAGPLFNFITFSLTGGVNYFDSHGNDYRHYYTNWYYRAEATMNYKNCTLVIGAQNHRNNFYGETCDFGESLMMTMFRYRIKNANIGLMTFNPFSSRNAYRRPTVNYSRYAPSYKSMHIRESARMLIVTFSWDFSFGRKYDGGKKQLNNQDNDSGTMNSGK
jgi:hypothetical protein